MLAKLVLHVELLSQHWSGYEFQQTCHGREIHAHLLVVLSRLQTTPSTIRRSGSISTLPSFSSNTVALTVDLLSRSASSRSIPSEGLRNAGVEKCRGLVGAAVYASQVNNQ